jgi:hypothetical protein
MSPYEPYLVPSANRISLAGGERVFLAKLQSARRFKDFTFPLVPTQWKREQLRLF